MTDPKSLERHVLNALLKDRKSERLWKIIRLLVWVSLLLLWAWLIFASQESKEEGSDIKTPYVSLIQLNGEIMPGRSFCARKVIPELIKAFQDKKARGIVLLINSPGGSPVQASIIHDKILFLKSKYQKKVVAIGEDALASGAYLVATAADKIYVNADTLTGSIGVVMSGFGFSHAIEKIGVSRRIFTAGKNKDRLDPFRPLHSEDASKIKQVLSEVHQHFINNVIQSRSKRLKGNPSALFSGDFWTGSTAVKLGLADGIGNLWEVLKKEFKVNNYKNYSTKPNLFQILLSRAESELHLVLSQQSSSQIKAELL